jgi:DNA primase
MAHDLSIAKEIIRETLDIVDLLEHYGVSVPQRNIRYDKVRSCCPLHDGDNDTAFSFDLNSKKFTCFTQHCGEDPSDGFWKPSDNHTVPRDVFLFIKLMEEKRAHEEGRPNFKCSFTQAVKIASDIAKVNIGDVCGYSKEAKDRLTNQRWMREMNRVIGETEIEVLTEEEIEIFKAQLPIIEDYVHARGLDEEIVEEFEVGYSIEGIDEKWNVGKEDFAGRLVFPIRDRDNNLVGWSGRLATDDKKSVLRYKKWRHKVDFEKGFVLYNYNKALEHIRQTNEIVLVEGPFDVLRFWSYGIKNVVAIMGSALTPEQLTLAVSSAFKVVIALDTDGAGEKGAKRICQQLKPYVDVYLADIPKDKDPDEMTIDEAIVSVMSPIKYYG